MWNAHPHNHMIYKEMSLPFPGAFACQPFMRAQKYQKSFKTWQDYRSLWKNTYLFNQSHEKISKKQIQIT